MKANELRIVEHSGVFFIQQWKEPVVKSYGGLWWRKIKTIDEGRWQVWAASFQGMAHAAIQFSSLEDAIAATKETRQPKYYTIEGREIK